MAVSTWQAGVGRKAALLTAVLVLAGIVSALIFLPVQAARSASLYHANDIYVASASHTTTAPFFVIPTGTVVLTYYAYLPIISSDKTEICRPIEGAVYGTYQIPNWTPPQRPAEEHGDLNLALRGYTLTTAYLGLIDMGGATDAKAPQLAGVFASPHAPQFTAVYRVYNWDWNCNCRDGLIDDWEVTLADLAATPGETVHMPDSGYEIGGGYEATVLYASDSRLTLKYTAEDNVVSGYTLHLENICVDPNLLSLYQSLDGAGRHSLPALRAGQAFGRVRNNGKIGLAIRDSGAFLDPRVRKDWWKDY